MFLRDWIIRKKMAKIIGALIRQILTVAGAGGIFGGDDVEQLAGAVSIIVSVIWSVLEKKNRRD
jgi:hypothetical protein